MTTLGQSADRACIGVLAPETNTTLAADLERMAVPGVVVCYGRLSMGSGQMADDSQQGQILAAARASIEGAVAEVLPFAPTGLLMGLSIETFQGGLAGSARLSAYLGQLIGGRPVAAGSEACVRALTLLGARRIGVITPYQPAAAEEVRRYFEEVGFAVLALESLRVSHAVAIAAASAEQIRAAIRAAAVPQVDAIVQCGTNLSILGLIDELEAEVGRPVLAMNATTYWHALRQQQIPDRLDGLGALLREH